MSRSARAMLVISIISLVCLGFLAGSVFAIEGKPGEVVQSEADLKALEAKGLLSAAQVKTYAELLSLTNGKIEIKPTTDLTQAQSDSYRADTAKYKGKAGIGPDGDLTNYVSGMPFPDVKPEDPQAALKAAWNMEMRHQGDDFWTSWEYWLVDSKGNTKVLGGQWKRLLWAQRTDMPQRPTLFPTNPDNIRHKETTGFWKPFSSKGLMQLTIKYLDAKKDQDTWVYVPGLRRETRVGAANRCDCLGGFVFNQDDSNLWDGNILDYTYKLVEVKDYIVPAIGAGPPKETIVIPEKAHTIMPPGFERRKVWVVDATPKNPNYCYGKRRWYLDVETWWILLSENYDHQGNVWKEHYMTYARIPTGYGGTTLINSGGTTVDHKIWEAGPWSIKEIKINSGLNPDDFTLDYLRRAAR